ncbi:MAG: hypothetical protein OXL37_15985 [Chloroflexota bacterium]|nr:hypothetical protein [Chloroflexota bacterium]MDE2959846.1 hypothetical protein [Chloroflexota bacterium]
MPLDDLVSVIETLQQRIATHRQSLQQNETRTRTALIDPLLTALGWDVSGPALVTPEYSVGNGRADYAPHGSESIPAAMVEAKRLGHALNDDERMQMLNYANARGVRHAVITDGNVWELYEVFKQAPLEDRRLLSLRIANTPAHELALQLLLLWRPNLASGQPGSANRSIFDPKEPAPEPPPSPPAPEEPPVAGWASLGKYNPPTNTNPPTEIKFPDSAPREIRRWYDILVATAEWLHSSGNLTTDTVPVEHTEKIYIVHTQPIHPTGQAFLRSKPIANGLLMVNIDYAASSCRRATRILLQHCGVDPTTVQLRVAE